MGESRGEGQKKQMSRKLSAAMAEEVYKLKWCRRCKKELTDEDMERAKKARFLPLCPDCDKLIKESLKKCLPLMQKLKLS